MIVHVRFIGPSAANVRNEYSLRYHAAMIVKRIVTNIATADVSKGSPIAVIGKIESATSGPSAEKLCAELRRAGVSYCEVQRARSTR